MKKITALITCLFMLVLMYSSVYASEIRVFVDDEKVDFGANTPISKDGRILTPAKNVFESVGAKITWVAGEKKAIIELENRRIEMVIGSKVVTVSSSDGVKMFESDVAPEIIKGSTYVPLGIVAESLGGGVIWRGEEKAVYLNFSSPLINPVSAKPFDMIISGNKINIDEPSELLIKTLGKSISHSQSVYSYTWNTYNIDNNAFALVGVNQNKVVAFYSNSKNVVISGITPGIDSDSLNKAVGRVLPLESKNVIVNDYGQLTIYRNANDNYSVIGVLAQKTAYANATTSLTNNYYNESTEENLIDLINSGRTNKNLPPLQRDSELSEVARDHSVSMAKASFLSHKGLDGKNPFERMSAKNITDYNMAAESIGRDAINAIEMYFLLSNSKVDEPNINAENFNYLGVGVAVGADKHKMYFTADFIER